MEAQDGAVDGQQDFEQVDEVPAIVGVTAAHVAITHAQKQVADDERYRVGQIFPGGCFLGKDRRLAGQRDCPGREQVRPGGSVASMSHC
jgi:hypothetical protein